MQQLDLPLAAPRRPAPKAAGFGVLPCLWCGARNFWLSIYGVLTCEQCHPPAAPALVKKRILAEPPTPDRVRRPRPGFYLGKYLPR